MSSTPRRGTIKKGIDQAAAKQRRGDSQVSLRKNKREEGLAKRRNVSVAEPADEALPAIAGSPAKPPARAYNSTDFPELLGALTTGDAAAQVTAMQGLRRMLSCEKNPPVESVVQAGFMPLMITALEKDDCPNLQFEACWALTNIGSTKHTPLLVPAGILPACARLLYHSRADIREQAAWCLGNIAGDSAELRDACLDAGGENYILKGLIANISSPANDSLLHNCAWSLSNLCRGKPLVRAGLGDVVVPHLADLLKNCKREDVLTESCWALSYLSDGPDERLDPLMAGEAVPLLVRLLQHPSSAVVTPALRAVGNVVTGSEGYTQAVVDAGALPLLAALLQHSKLAVRKEACWAFSNVAAGTRAQIAAVCETPGALSGLVTQLTDGEFAVKKEACWAISNVATGGTRQSASALLDEGAVEPLCAVLQTKETAMIMVAMEALDALLESDSEGLCVVFMEEAGGIEALEELQQHDEDRVYKKAVKMLEKYFSDEMEEQDQNCMPDASGNTFVFGMQPAAPAGCGGSGTAVSGSSSSSSNAGFQFGGSSQFNFAPSSN